MTVKQQVIELFEKNKGEYFSGEEIANKISVSRNAVWKAVKSLQSEGYDISAVTNKGYCLSQKTDALSASLILEYLGENAKKFDIEVFKSLPSTNSYIKELAEKGEKEGKVIICEEQTAGRGRKGRSFFSPNGTGVYMSLLLRPNTTSKEATLLTTLTAVCVCEAIEELSDREAKIKWVNDVYIGERKVSGILTEASFNMENGTLDYVVVGVGINVFMPNSGFPDDIGNIATTILGKEKQDIRNSLIAKVLEKIHYYYSNLSEKEFCEKYKQRSCIIGKEITVVESSKSYPAVALDIDEDCRLVIKTKDGIKKTISNGEISVRI